MPPSRINEREFNVHPSSEFHGTDGPIRKSFPIWHTAIQTPLIKSYESIGVHLNPDPVLLLIIDYPHEFKLVKLG